MAWLVQVVLSCLLFGLCLGYGHFRDEIPNGNRVAHPCMPNILWRGVGHKNARGSGEKNPFGELFLAQGSKWTRELCMADSDSDGQTNGYELGDPDCEWTKGERPQRVDDITHPGVCTPFDSEACRNRNDWVDCSPLELECDALSKPDTRNVTLRWPRTKVPAQTTTHMCMVFDIPKDDTYHLVATRPVIDNDNVMHHMLFFGCDNDDDPLLKEPFPCEMSAPASCNTMLGGWSVGSPGLCLHENVGYVFGREKFKRIAIDFHWNNPKHADDWYDGSGVTLYYTNILRPNNGSMFRIGQAFIEIPKETKNTTLQAVCTSDCLSHTLSQNIYITMAANHMHYLGMAQYIEHWRDGQLLNYITNEPDFNYDAPKIFTMENPIEVRPTDEIITRCHFNSEYTKRYVYNTGATEDEMCLGFMQYYPAEALSTSFCGSYKSVAICRGDQRDLIYEDCNFSAFILPERRTNDTQKLFDDVTNMCNIAGICHEDCRNAVEKANAHPCLAPGHKRDFVWWRMNTNVEGLQFFAKLGMCDDEVDGPETSSAIVFHTSTVPTLLLGSFIALYNVPKLMITL